MEPSLGNPDLLAYMRRQIATHGPVTFKWFMQQALYHPSTGTTAAGGRGSADAGTFTRA